MNEHSCIRLASDKSPPSDTEINCGVDEECFPCMKKCCNECSTAVDFTYCAICEQCTTWTSFPDSTSLEVITVLECKRYGYVKRIKK